MAVLAAIGLAAAWTVHGRSDDAAGRAGLPLIGLTLSGEDIAHFERIYTPLVGDNPDYQFYRDRNRWRRAQLRYDGAVYNVRVKRHGRVPSEHWVERDGQRFISLSVRMAPGDRVAGLNKFKLIVRENLIMAQPLVMRMAREAQVLVQDHRLVRVQINDSREKLFYFSNRLDDIPAILDLSGSRTLELQLNTYRGGLEWNALPMFYFVASSDRVRQTIYRAVYRFIVQDGGRLVREIERGLVAGSVLTPAELAIVRPAARAGSDTDAAPAWSGETNGRGESREVLTSNIRSLRRYLERSAPEYSAQFSHGQVVLAIRPGSMAELRVKTLTIGVRDGARMVDTPVMVHVTEDPGAAGDPTSDSSAVDWLPDGRLDVSRALADARFATGLDSSIPPASLPLPRINVRWVDGLDADRRRGLEARFGLDAEEGESSTWSYGLADASLENITALVGHPEVEDTHYIDRVEMTLEEGAFRAAAPRYWAPSQERVPRLYVLALTVTGVAADDLRPEDIDLVFVNTVTGQEVEARRVAAHDLGDGPSGDRPTALPPAPAVEAWLAAHPHLDIRQIGPGELRLRRGTYRLPEHLVLPRGYNLYIESGTDLQLGVGVVLLVRGGLNISGTVDQPVTIRPIEPGQPFGTVAVVGDGSQRTDVTWLELSGGSDAWLDGAQFAGALSIHYQDSVSVSHTTIRDNQGADGLSIKYAAGAVTDSSFTGNRDDQVDLEYFDGLVRDNRFESAPSGDSNGDGLDLRGSRVVVVNNELTGATDKAASVGEQSEALFVSNRVGHSAIGVAVKDLSTAYLYDNRFEENGRDVRATMKQPFFGGGRVVFVGAGPREADLSVDIDDRSTLTRMPAGAVERLDTTGMRPERVVESFSALSAASGGR